MNFWIRARLSRLERQSVEVQQAKTQAALRQRGHVSFDDRLALLCGMMAESAAEEAELRSQIGDEAYEQLQIENERKASDFEEQMRLIPVREEWHQPGFDRSSLSCDELAASLYLMLDADRSSVTN